MAHGRPWYKRNGADFVMATLSMPDAETKWAYSCLIDMLNDRDRPLNDDAGFICGFTGLSKKKWAIVRRYLIDQGYLVETGDGRITNPRFERERAERERDREEAVENGRRGGKKSAALRAAGQGDLDLAPEDQANNRGDKRPINDPKVGRRTKDKSETSNDVTKENKDLDEAPPQATRARERASEARGESIIQTTDSSTVPPGEARDRSLGPDADLVELLEACSDACGYRPSQPGQITKAIDMVKGWKEAGIDFDKIVIPTIRHMIANSTDPTSSLARFDKRIRHEHARAAAQPQGTGAYRAPPTPILEFDGEDRRFVDFRRDLCEALGPQLYCHHAHHLRFKAIEERQALQIENERSYSRLYDGERVGTITKLAKKHGFKAVWG